MSNIVNSVFESKPQHITYAEAKRPKLCQISLILFLKANHNKGLNVSQQMVVVSNIVNSVFESKPQLVYEKQLSGISCVKYR